MTRSSNNEAQKLLALRELQGRKNATHAFARILPLLIRESDIGFADTLIDAFELHHAHAADPNFFPYMAELFALLSLPNTDRAKRSRWTAVLTGSPGLEQTLGETMQDLTSVFRKIGALGFSFPIWRFLAKRLQCPGQETHPALLEQAGMVRLDRTTDTFCDKDKKQDWLGTGYITSSGKAEIEYRRSYLRVSLPNEGHLLIRNSSYFWGRDRFEHPAYFSPHPLPAERLLGLTPSEVDWKKLFLPITSWTLWGEHADNTRRENVFKLCALTAALSGFEANLSNWLCDNRTLPTRSPGFPLLLDYLSAWIRHHREPLPVLGFIHPELPPWFPYAALKIDGDVLAALLRLREGCCLNRKADSEVFRFFETGISHRAKLVLLSGEKGDFPIG